MVYLLPTSIRNPRKAVTAIFRIALHPPIALVFKLRLEGKLSLMVRPAFPDKTVGERGAIVSQSPKRVRSRPRTRLRQCELPGI